MKNSIMQRSLFTNENQHLKITSIIERIEKSIADYIGLKTFVSLITGVLINLTE